MKKFKRYDLNMKDLRSILWQYRMHSIQSKRNCYKKIEMLGPEHEFSLINNNLEILPIAEKVVKDYYESSILTRIRKFVILDKFLISKEFPLQQVEFKARQPFCSPQILEEAMQAAVGSFLEFIDRKYNARLLGTGMHPMLQLEETGTRPSDKIAEQYSKVFQLRRHGWLNLQSNQLNLSYSTEEEAVSIYNALSQLSAYLPAVSASSPICEGALTPYADFRLFNYKTKSLEIPSVAGDVVPEYISSFCQFRSEVADKYLSDLSNAGLSIEESANYVDQRLVVPKFFRNAIEVRAMDEQECIKSDVALSCFVRAAVRGLLDSNAKPWSHKILVNDYNLIIKDGLDALVLNPVGKTAKQVCQFFLDLAVTYADEREKKYLWIIDKRIKEGNLSDLIRRRVSNRAQKTSFHEAIKDVYRDVAKCLCDNQPYF